MKLLKETKIKLVFIIIFFMVGYSLEFIYRKPLYDNSVEIAKSVQGSLSWSTTFFKYYAYIGVIEFYLAIIFFIFFPINYCFTFFLNLVISVHLCSFAKLIYSQGRPFLLDKSVYVTCESGYGNPSGHSFQFTSNLLAFAQMFIDFFKLNKKYCIIIYIICAILILSINLSRIVLGVHSINQVIFGDTLGFTVYFVICKIIQPHKIEINKLFGAFLNLKFHIINLVAIIINAISLTIAAIVVDNTDSENYEILKDKIKEICKKSENGMLSRDAKTKYLYILAYYGMICGMTLLSYYVKHKYNEKYEELNYYYRNTKSKWYIKYGSRILFTGICYIPQISIYTNKNINIYVIYILGSAFPMFIYGFMLFSINYILTIELHLANDDLYISFPKVDKNDEYILGETNN